MVKVKVLLCVMLLGLHGTAWAGKQVVCAAIGKWPPMEYLDEEGKMVGYTVDLLQAAGRIAGFTIEFRLVDEKDIVSGLQSGMYDAICSSMINQGLRKKDLAFSTPYLMARQTLVIYAKRKMSASTDRSGMRMGAVKDSYGMAAVREMQETLPSEYDNISRAMEDVYTGSINGAVCDDPVARYLAHGEYNKKLKLTGYLANSKKKPLSVAVTRENKELLKLLNSGISTVRARGIDKELQRKWFSR